MNKYTWIRTYDYCFCLCAKFSVLLYCYFISRFSYTIWISTYVTNEMSSSFHVKLLKVPVLYELVKLICISRQTKLIFDKGFTFNRESKGKWSEDLAWHRDSLIIESHQVTRNTLYFISFMGTNCEYIASRPGIFKLLTIVKYHTNLNKIIN